MVYLGDLDELVACLETLGVKGDWSQIEHGHQFRARAGATMQWYTKRGTLTFGGPATTRKPFEEAVRSFLNDGVIPASPVRSPAAATTPPSVPEDKRVFVVHGHDREAREQLELILRKLDLEPFVLMNTAGDGLTIIEALEREIVHPQSRVKFGIVLLTPDDFGYSNDDVPTNAAPRARQNVVLEMGMLMAAVGRANVAMLVKGSVELPSDTNGILHAGFNSHVREAVPKLVERLQRAGFDLQATKIASATA